MLRKLLRALRRVTLPPTTTLETRFGTFRVTYHKIRGHEYVSLVLGNVSKRIPIVRLQSACIFSEAFFSCECDCAQQREEAMTAISDFGSGVVVYSYKQEGRGIGLKNKIRAMDLEHSRKCSSEQAFTALGYDPDMRDYRGEIEVLRRLNVFSRIVCLRSNDNKKRALEKAGFNVEVSTEGISVPTGFRSYRSFERSL